MNSELSQIKDFFDKKSAKSFEISVIHLSTYIDDGGEITNIDKQILYSLFYQNSEYLLDYMKIDINRVKSSNALEDSIFFSITDYMRKNRGNIGGIYVNKDILIDQISQIVDMSTNIDNIIKIRNILGLTLYYEHDKLFIIAPKLTQALFDHNTTLLAMIL